MKLIRKLAIRGDFAFSTHAFDERMVERGFDQEDVLKIIEFGEIVGDIEPGKKVGEWRCCVVGKLQWTSREAGVVTVVMRERKLLFVTVEWMDP